MEYDTNEVDNYEYTPVVTTGQILGYIFAGFLALGIVVFLITIADNEERITTQATARTCQEQEFSETEECIQFRSAQKYQAFNDRVQYYRKLR